MAVTHSTSMRNATVDLLNSEIGGAGNFAVIATNDTDVLVLCPFSATPFGVGGATNPGEAEANAITTTNATAAGTAGFFEYRTGGAAMVSKGTLLESLGDLTITNAAINIGDPIAVQNLVHRAMP